MQHWGAQWGFFQAQLSRFASSHLSHSTDALWGTWNKIAVESLCHGLGCLLAGRQDSPPPNAKVLRSYGKPVFIKVPLYQQPSLDFRTITTKHIDRHLPIVKQHRRLQTLLNTARRSSPTNLLTSTQQWAAIVSHSGALHCSLPDDLEAVLGLPFQQTPSCTIHLEKLSKTHAEDV